MRSQGQVVKWFDEKGFGFVAAQASGAEVFLHVRDLPRTGRRPAVGDRLQFEIESDAQGRKRAVRVTWEDPLPGAAAARPTRAEAPAAPRRDPGRPSYRRPRRETRQGLTGPGGIVVAVVMIVIAGVLVWEHAGPPADHSTTTLAAAPGAAPVAAGQSFTCDARKHCSEMRSCEEARYFARNCPDTLMDGDGDGRACEDRCP